MSDPRSARSGSSGTEPLLVITADDYGLTDGVCRAIAAAHRRGVVTATSVLAVGRSFDYGAQLLRDLPTLAVGAHLALVGEDPPLLSAREIPTLVGKSGRFPLTYRTVAGRAALRRIDPDDVRREFAAQLARIRDAGLQPEHLDTHQHLHLWPSIGRVVADLAVESGIRAVRRPWSAGRGPTGFAVRLLGRSLARRLRDRQLLSTATYAGLDEAGRLDRAGVERALRRAAERAAGSLEINTHPGEEDDDMSRFAWSYRWSDELRLLQAPATAELIEERGFRLGSMSSLGGSR